MAAAKMSKAQLVREVEAYTRGIAGELGEAVPTFERVHLRDACPESRAIPVAALRRLHAALSEFVAEAQAAELHRTGANTGASDQETAR